MRFNVTVEWQDGATELYNNLPGEWFASRVTGKQYNMLKSTPVGDTVTFRTFVEYTARRIS
jgi:hypothetical protein